MLYPLRPKAAGSPIYRVLFLAEDLWKFLYEDIHDDDMEDRIGTLLADLEQFVTSEEITPKYLFLLYPSRDAVWEIRSVQDKPSIRVLGLFAAWNVLVATNMALREELGGWESRQWKQVKRKARAAWNSILQPYAPVVTTKVQRVVSGAIDGKYFRGK